MRARDQDGRQLPAEVATGRLQPLSSEAAAAAKAKVAADEVVLAEDAADLSAAIRPPAACGRNNRIK